MRRQRLRGALKSLGNLISHSSFNESLRRKLDECTTQFKAANMAELWNQSSFPHRRNAVGDATLMPLELLLGRSNGLRVVRYFKLKDEASTPRLRLAADGSQLDNRMSSSAHSVTIGSIPWTPEGSTREEAKPGREQGGPCGCASGRSCLPRVSQSRGLERCVKPAPFHACTMRVAARNLGAWRTSGMAKKSMRTSCRNGVKDCTTKFSRITRDFARGCDMPATKEAS